MTIPPKLKIVAKTLLIETFGHIWLVRVYTKVKIVKYRNLPTRPNSTQYIAANIVKGIDANRAPNLPVIDDSKRLSSRSIIHFL